MRIESVPIQGGSPTLLATSNGRILGFAVSGPNIYFVDSDGTKTLPTSGGAVRLLTSQVASGASGLAVIGSQVIVTEGNGMVVAVPVAGGPLTTLATQQQSASFPLACGTDVCWWTGAAPNPMVSDGPGEIARLDANGDLTTVPGAPSYPWALAFDGSSFFEAVGCDVCPGSIVRVPISGTPVTMTSGGFVAVDEQCAYFSTIQAYPLPEGGSGMGIFSVSKSYSTCCDASGQLRLYDGLVSRADGRRLAVMYLRRRSVQRSRLRSAAQVPCPEGPNRSPSVSSAAATTLPRPWPASSTSSSRSPPTPRTYSGRTRVEHVPLLATAALAAACASRAPAAPNPLDEGGDESGGGFELGDFDSGGVVISSSSGAGGSASSSGPTGSLSCTTSAGCLPGQVCCGADSMTSMCQAGPCPTTAIGPVQLCGTSIECLTAGDTCGMKPILMSLGLSIMVCSAPGNDGGGSDGSGGGGDGGSSGDGGHGGDAGISDAPPDG